MVNAKIYAFPMYGWYTPRDCKEMQPSTFGNFIFKIRGVLGGEREECETQSKRVKLVQLQFNLTDKEKHKQSSLI